MYLNHNIKIFIDRISNDCLISDNKFVKVYNFFIINWYTITEEFDSSNIIFLDLCWVNSGFIDQTKEKINKYLLLNKKIVLFWCISNIFKEQYLDRLIYIDSKNYSKIEEYFNFKIQISQVDKLNFPNKLSIIDTDNLYKNYKLTLRDFNNSSFITISEWCSLNCSYCNIKKIKWETLSRKEKDILEEIALEINNWRKTIYLLSDDCWSYWIDTGTNIADLLDNIFSLDNNVKIHITNIYPLFFMKYYERLKTHILSWKILSIVLPVQHTSERILKLMNRKYNIDKLIEILKEIKLLSNIQLQNHIIFDYYNEWLEEFVDTFKLLRYYDKNFYFRYSDINNIYWKDFISNNLKEKIVLLKKLQNKYNIDITI